MTLTLLRGISIRGPLLRSQRWRLPLGLVSLPLLHPGGVAEMVRWRSLPLVLDKWLSLAWVLFFRLSLFLLLSLLFQVVFFHEVPLIFR